MADYVGHTFGNYQIQERLGRGGMAEVYRAYHSNLNRSVAVKVLHPHLAEAADFIGRFRREAQAVARLHHPNIVQVYDFDAQNDVNYMVMELVVGQSLKALLDDLFLRGERLPLLVTLSIFQAVLEAVGYAHSQGMVHRDLKPANVMLADKDDGRPKQEGGGLPAYSFRPVLMDFGIAKIIGSEKFTATGAAMGTPAYMSPEQGQGEAGDERSDLYALGIMLYECLTGQVPYEGDTSVSVLLKHITAPVPALNAVRPDLPEALGRVVSQALAKDPRDRFQTAQEFWDALAAVTSAGDQPTVAPTTRAASLPPKRLSAELPTRPRLALSKPFALGAVVAGVALLALAGFLLWPRLLGPAPTTQAQALLAEAKYQQAADAFTTILSAEANNVAALLGRAEAYEALGQVEDALADVEQVLALAPNNSAGYREHGRLLAQYFGEDPTIVLADLDRAVELAGSDPTQAARALYTRGWMYFNFVNADGVRDLAAALNDLQQATTLDPQLLDAQLTLARALLANGQAPDALTPANRAIELIPTSALPHHLRAQINFALNDLHPVQDDLTAALERETDAQLLAVLYTERAYVARLLGDEGGALADVQAALSHDARSLIALALAAHLDLQPTALTPAQLTEALAAAPDDPIWQAILQTP